MYQCRICYCIFLQPEIEASGKFCPACGVEWKNIAELTQYYEIALFYGIIEQNFSRRERNLLSNRFID